MRGLKTDCGNLNLAFERVIAPKMQYLLHFGRLSWHVRNEAGSSRLLALDWKKAFDSTNVDSLFDALHRFGIPDPCLHMVRNMMLH